MLRWRSFFQHRFRILGILMQADRKISDATQTGGRILNNDIRT
jgi:hypothetical protein